MTDKELVIRAAEYVARGKPEYEHVFVTPDCKVCRDDATTCVQVWVAIPDLNELPKVRDWEEQWADFVDTYDEGGL